MQKILENLEEVCTFFLKKLRAGEITQAQYDRFNGQIYHMEEVVQEVSK